MERLPGLPWSKIRAHAHWHGIRRRKKPYCLTRYPLLDAIRQRCWEMGYSMVDIDEFAGTGEFFQCAQWWRSKRKIPLAINKAVDVQGGTMQIQWSQ